MNVVVYFTKDTSHDWEDNLVIDEFFVRSQVDYANACNSCYQQRITNAFEFIHTQLGIDVFNRRLASLWWFGEVKIKIEYISDGLKLTLKDLRRFPKTPDGMIDLRRNK